MVGTAGHIDHGKTSLIRALTGIDTDRLEEEKRRGISIDLGFAHLQLTDSLRVAFIDVPGHEKFIRNMLAGIGGIDVVLLAVAADESIKPQTREHFDICRLLRIPRGLVVLTRSDLADNDIAELVRMEVEEFLAGSFLEGAPILRVSSVTGEGLPELRETLRRIAESVPKRDSARNFRLPVDRAFVMRGFGTVVTGTVLAGGIGLETELDLHPGRKRVRVRGIQVHGQAAERADAGQRAALNITGADIADAGRGSMLIRPGSFRPTRTVDCILELLHSAKPLKHRAPVHFHAASSEVLAEVRTPERTSIEPGSIRAVRILLGHPLVMAPGDRFIIRMFSPVVTIGGGEVADPFPPAKLKASEAIARTTSLARAELSQRMALLTGEAHGGLSRVELSIRTGATEAALDAANPPEEILLVRDPQPWFVHRSWLQGQALVWQEQVAQFHRTHPLLPGIPREEFRGRVLPGVPPFIFDLVLGHAKSLVSTGDIIHLSSHKLALKQDEERALSIIERAFEQGGLAVPGVKEVLESSGIDAKRARSLLQILLREKRLIRVTEDLIFHPVAMSALRRLMSERQGSRFTVSEFKEWTGVSRKYAIPLLEYLDRERISRRDGDVRTVL